MRRRRFLQLAGASLAMPAVARAAGKDRVLRFVPQADLALLDPIVTPAFVTRNHGFMVFDTLYGVDDAYVARPQMVAGHVVEQDGLLWRLTLRNGLRFHDGEPVRARDVVASLKRWGARDLYGFDLMAAIDEMTAPSDAEVRIRLRHLFPTLPDVLGKANTNMPCIMPERLAKLDPFKPIPEVIGSGPFKFLAAERVPGARNVYERFAEYVPREGGPPSFLSGPKVAHLDRVEWRTIPDAATAAAALQTGEIDWWEQPIPDLVASLARDRDLRTEVQDEAGFLGLMRVNHLQPPFDNPALRRALLMGLSQADVMTAVAGDDPKMWRDGIGYMTPGSMANDAGMERLSSMPDLAKAKAAVQASGYRGERVVFIAPTDFPSINAMSEVTADMFRRIGLNVDYQAMDWGTMVQRWSSTQPVSAGGWSALCVFTTAVCTITPADNKFIRGIGSKGIYGWPTSTALEAMRDEYLATSDPDVRLAICRRLQEQAFEDVPYLPLGVYFQPTARRSTVTGLLKGFPLFYNVRKA
ncbi:MULTISPECIES: ABC transporter substrate-binding protein [unclassified Methylobacterium]|uniref:ABC transporter substrate-binding protein n=1 Tax=unclassified Methylobacterium TaxID=2615210 RepID=UPI00226AA817|nr:MULTISPECIES: ABC transporter substrate-binding protein [unclassified Methylobacterium]